MTTAIEKKLNEFEGWIKDIEQILGTKIDTTHKINEITTTSVNAKRFLKIAEKYGKKWRGKLSAVDEIKRLR